MVVVGVAVAVGVGKDVGVAEGTVNTGGLGLLTDGGAIVVGVGIGVGLGKGPSSKISAGHPFQGLVKPLLPSL
jgi:hypothetical protein